MPTEYERIRDTATRLAVSRETIRLWAVKGYFPGAFRAPGTGTEWRIPKDSTPDFTAGTPKRPRRKIRRTPA